LYELQRRVVQNFIDPLLGIRKVESARVTSIDSWLVRIETAFLTLAVAFLPFTDLARLATSLLVGTSS
jgi:hypothetical protein